MYSRIRVFAVGLLAIGLASSGIQALAVAPPSHSADQVETYRLESLVEGWLSSFFATHRIPASQSPKRHTRGSQRLQEKEGSHMDPNGLH